MTKEELYSILEILAALPVVEQETSNHALIRIIRNICETLLSESQEKK